MGGTRKKARARKNAIAPSRKCKSASKSLDPTETPNTDLTLLTASTSQQDQGTEPAPLISDTSDPKKYESLGLGRGVDVTNNQMWRNKSAFIVKKVDASSSNVIETEEGNFIEEYEKEVSTTSALQLKIRLSLNEPNSQVKIGIDAQRSQSSSQTRKISGTRLHTKTVAFRVQLADLSRVSKNSKKEKTDPVGEFEDDLCFWILRRWDQRRGQGRFHTKSENVTTKLCGVVQEKKKMRKHRKRNTRKQARKALRGIFNDFQAFVTEIGVTHYVSAIELGAMEYSVSTLSTRQMTLGAGAELGASGYAEGEISGVKKTSSSLETKEGQKIGAIVDGVCEKEAVIGYEIQPIYTLLKNPSLCHILKKVTQEYIMLKTDKSRGPFLISCKVNKKAVYWKAKEGTEADSSQNQGALQPHCYSIVGTESLKDASLFYIIPAEDAAHPYDFFIAFWGSKCKDRKVLTNLSECHACKRKKEPFLPRYLSVRLKMLGHCDGPLELHSTVHIKKAKLCLHNRVQRSFPLMTWSTPVSLNSWVEGEEFFINCSRHSIRIGGYIAMAKNASEETYKTIAKPIVGTPTIQENLGMLFRLHSPQYKYSKSGKKTSTPVQQAKKRHSIGSSSKRRSSRPSSAPLVLTGRVLRPSSAPPALTGRVLTGDKAVEEPVEEPDYGGIAVEKPVEEPDYGDTSSDSELGSVWDISDCELCN